MNADSVKARLKNLAIAEGKPFDYEFVKAKDRQLMWSAFIKRMGVIEGVGFDATMMLIKNFLKPVYQAILSGSEWTMMWNENDKLWE